MSDVKRCSRCGETKACGEFHRNGSKAHGLQSQCKACKAEFARQYCADPVNRERKAEYDRQYYADPVNRERRAERDRKYNADPVNRGRTREQHLMRTYKLTLEQWSAIFESQGSVCKLCGADMPGGHGQWHTDHDKRCCPGEKSCGKCVRGILCQRCNTQIGSYEKWVASPLYSDMVAYIYSDCYDPEGTNP